MKFPKTNRGIRAPFVVDLVTMGSGSVTWHLGETIPGTGPSGSILRKWDVLKDSKADAVFFWDPELGEPCTETVLRMLTSPWDLWHAGLLLGMNGLPTAVDFVQPTWMFNCDPPPDVEATSWRVSLRACLVRTEVLRKMGFLRHEFATAEAAALEWGHRLLSWGVLMRHVPSLLPDLRVRESEGGKRQRSVYAASDAGAGIAFGRLPFTDQLRFISYRYGRKWAAWVSLRAVVTGCVCLRDSVLAWREVMPSAAQVQSCLYRNLREEAQIGPAPQPNEQSPSSARPVVSVVIPTIRRYPYLRTLLRQLAVQTVQPHEVLIVDQTPVGERDCALAEGCGKLSVRLMHQDQPGQCVSRNAALRQATGDYILFLDDDDEVAPDLIERHLRALSRFEAEVSCGVVEDKESGPPSGTSLILRASDVFPTNNTLIRKDVLCRSGLFDLAYDRGARADGDLGMRLYLAGARMVLNPSICLFHHHAPQGGLRVHGARVITRTSSRAKVWQRHLPSPTEMYLARRYFTARQIRESKWIRALGTFSSGGTVTKKVAKVMLSLLMLPATIRAISQSDVKAKTMLKTYPQIPDLCSDRLSRGLTPK